MPASLPAALPADPLAMAGLRAAGTRPVAPPAADGNAGAGIDPALAEAATRFESLILGEMLRAMRRATTGTGLARSEAERTFRDLQDRIWAEGLARAAPIGLVARLEAQGRELPAASLAGTDGNAR